MTARHRGRAARVLSMQVTSRRSSADRLQRHLVRARWLQRAEVRRSCLPFGSSLAKWSHCLGARTNGPANITHTEMLSLLSYSPSSWLIPTLADGGGHKCAVRRPECTRVGDPGRRLSQRAQRRDFELRRNRRPRPNECAKSSRRASYGPHVRELRCIFGLGTISLYTSFRSFPSSPECALQTLSSRVPSPQVHPPTHTTVPCAPLTPV